MLVASSVDEKVAKTVASMAVYWADWKGVSMVVCLAASRAVRMDIWMVACLETTVAAWMGYSMAGLSGR